MFAGANTFAIEADGEWEIVQAREIVLVGEREYELSGFLRGQLGSAHAMRAPHPVGTRIVKIDERLARTELNAHEWNEALAFLAPPAGGAASDPRALALSATLPRANARQWAPAHARAKRQANGDVLISWVRCARSGDSWSEEPPLDTVGEAYILEIMSGTTLKRSVSPVEPSYLYPVAQQVADFGAQPASLKIRVAQLGELGALGLKTELTLAL